MTESTAKVSCNVSAKMRCTSVTIYPGEGGREIKFSAVYSNDPASPNYSWSKYTPQGELSLRVTNPAAYNQFEPGKEYVLLFAEAPA